MEGTFPSGNKDIVGLREFGLGQAVKDIIDVDFLRARSWSAPQPCLFRAPRKAFSASVTIDPIVMPWPFACLRSSSTVCSGSFNVIGTDGSVTSTGQSSREASSKYR